MVIKISDLRIGLKGRDLEKIDFFTQKHNSYSAKYKIHSLCYNKCFKNFGKGLFVSKLYKILVYLLKLLLKLVDEQIFIWLLPVLKVLLISKLEYFGKHYII